MVRILKYAIATFILIIIALSIAGFIIGRYYQDEVRRLLLNELNKHIETEISVGNVSFSVLRKFPQGSLEFRDVIIKAPEGYKFEYVSGISADTVLTARRLFLQFNIRDIFRQKYNIKRIHASGGVINLAVNSDNEENFRFWRTATGSAREFNIDLQDIRLADFRLKFASANRQIYTASHIDRFQTRGNFGKSSYLLNGVLHGSNYEFNYPGINLSGERALSIRGALKVDGNIFDIEEGNIDIGGIRLKAEGIYEGGEAATIDMNISGAGLDIESLARLLEGPARELTGPYMINGKFDFGALLTGRINEPGGLSLTADITARKGEIMRRETGMSLTSVTLSGRYKNGDLRNPSSAVILIDNFSCDMGQGSYSGKGSISNLSQPLIDIEVSASLLLEELARFYKPDNIEEISGAIETSFSASGKLNKLFKWRLDEFNNLDVKGYLEVDNGILGISGSKYMASSVSGKLQFGDKLSTPGLSFNIGSDHFSLNGEIERGLDWLLGSDHTMAINGRLHSKNLNIDNYIPPPLAGHTSGGVAEPLWFPSNLELNLDFVIDHLTFRNFSSTGFTGKLSYKPRMMVLNAVEFSSMEGAVSGNGVIVQRMNGDFMVQSQLTMNDLDMQKMFLSFNNFGQTFIDGGNLNGRLTGTLGFISEWNPYLRLIDEKIVADSKVEITSGELINFEPMLGLARFIEISELRHIRFSKLNNEVYIRNGVVTIPYMDINSSAFNISGSGKHRFDGYFDYRLRVLLSDVLYGRAKNAKPENQEFGVIEDDGLGRTSLYLLVSGTSDDYKVSYDTRAVREVLRENIASERNALRKLLHEEFGWFSRDTLVVGEPVRPEPNGGRFTITWDEEEEKITPQTGPEKPSGANRPDRERRFKMIWDEEQNL
jgi:hypothetical protein